MRQFGAACASKCRAESRRCGSRTTDLSRASPKVTGCSYVACRVSLARGHQRSSCPFSMACCLHVLLTMAGVVITDDSRDVRRPLVRSQGRGPGREVLVVDDERLVRESVAAALEQRGYRVKQGRSGEEAIEAAKETYFEVVVLDQRMPSGMDGLEVLRWLRPPQRARAVVIITGDKAGAVEEAARRLGAAACLEKPFSVAELVRAVEEAWGRARAADRP